MKARPTGISILGFIFIALGTVSFIWSLLVFGMGGVSSLFGSIFTLSPQMSGNVWAGILGMATAAVQFATGVGLLRIKTWAWYLAFIAVGLSVVQGLFGLFNGGLISCLCAAIGLIIPVAIAVYLLRADIRALFDIGSS